MDLEAQIAAINAKYAPLLAAAQQTQDEPGEAIRQVRAQKAAEIRAAKAAAAASSATTDDTTEGGDGVSPGEQPITPSPFDQFQPPEFGTGVFDPNRQQTNLDKVNQELADLYAMDRTQYEVDYQPVTELPEGVSEPAEGADVTGEGETFITLKQAKLIQHLMVVTVCLKVAIGLRVHLKVSLIHMTWLLQLKLKSNKQQV